MYIGIDLGTSSVKLLLMDADGRILRIASKDYPISYPQPGWSEQSPEDWYTQTLAGLRELSAGYEKEIKGISFSGQMHGLVCLDARDRILRPAILWNDGRTARECEYLNHTIGRDLLSKETGNIAFAGFTAPKLLWMRENEPELYAQIAKIALPKDYLAYRFSGVHATDVSDASGMLLFDVEHRRWSEKMCEICGVKKEWLAKVYESYEVIGTVTLALADELSFSRETKIIIGAGDNAAAAVGTGTVGDGDCNISLGTSGTIFISSDRYSVDPQNALHSFAHANGRYHLMGCMLSAASCNQWWLEGILQEKDYAAAQSGITELGKNPVYFLPYLMGERSPHNDPDARGAFIGLRMDTGRAELLQAIYEGVAFALRDSYEVARASGIRILRTKICGGGAKSPLWRRIIANVMDIPVDCVESEEGPALGAAMLAAVGCGQYRSVGEAAQAIVRVSDTVEPETPLAALYEERYQTFRQLYPALKPIYPAICSSASKDRES